MEVDLKKIICFDTETTGIDQGAEILDLSIVNAKDEVLFNEYIRPKHHASWPEAERVHHISPEMLAEKGTIDAHYDRIMEILNHAEYYVGYNVVFDIRMLKQSGIPTSPFHRPGVHVIDVMKHFKQKVPGRRYRLVDCAAYFNYDWKLDAAHGALADTKATLYCFKKLNQLS